MAQVAVARSLYRYIRPLLRTLSRSSGPVDLGTFSASDSFAFINVYPDWLRAANQSLYRGRWSWQRTSVPFYGSLAASIPVVLVDVPDNLVFRFSNEPSFMPTIAIGEPRAWERYRAANLPLPSREMQVSFAPPRGIPPGPPDEGWRKRYREDKLDTPYGSLLTWLKKNYSRFSEYMDANVAIYYGWPDPVAMSRNLAFNEFIDRSIGWKARMYREHIYKSPGYNLPVGLTTLSRLFPGDFQL